MNLALIAWIALGLIWGSNFIFMKWATDFISPSQVVFVRVVVGFIPVLGYTLIKKQLHLKHIKFFPHFLAMACLAAAIYYYGFAKGASLLPSGIAGAISGAIPLFSILTALLFLSDEHINRNKLLGITIGFVGVLIIARPFQGTVADSFMEGVIYMVLGSLSLGISFIYARKYITPLQIPAAALATYQLILASLLLLLVTDLNGISRVMDDPVSAWGLILGLGLLGTGVAYILYYYIVASLGAIAASSVTYLPPVVALIISGVFLQENLETRDYFATVLIFIGVFLVNKKTT